MRSISVIMIYPHAENSEKKADRIEMLTGITHLSMETYIPSSMHFDPDF